MIMLGHFLLTIDVEDWFQVENFKQCIPYASWPSRELRVERNTRRLLDLLDSIEPKKTGDEIQDSASGNNPQPATSNMHTKNPLKATFFVLGWIAERLPTLVREIRARGHEVASHGYHHELCSGQACYEFERDLCDSKKLLEDLIGEPVYGYRAPSFSVSDDVLKSIAGCGYLYDSSYNSFAMHGRYGEISLNGHERRGIAVLLNQKFYELPISNLTIRKPFPRPIDPAPCSEQSGNSFVLPWGGGGYFRLIPGWVFRMGVGRILSEEGAYVFYMHPWEIDPEQPRVEEAPRSFRFRHYVNLGKTEKRLSDMLRRFADCRFVTCYEYLKGYAQTEKIGVMENWRTGVMGFEQPSMKSC